MTFKTSLFTEEEKILTDMVLNQCPTKVQEIKKSETMLSKSQSKFMSLKDVFRKGKNLGGGETQPRSCAFSSQKWPRTLE